MRTRWLLPVLLLISVSFACGDGADVAGPAAGTDTVAWETLLAQAATRVRELGDDDATRADADRLARRLEELAPTATAVQALVDEPVALPLDVHHRMARRLGRTASRLVTDARKIESTTAAFAPAASDMLELRERLAELQKLFVERVGVGGPEVAMRDLDLTRATFDDARIYHGNTDRFRKPAEVDLDEVYGHIPAYRKILREKPDEDSPTYYFLLLSAGRTFRAALQSVSAKEGYDLIGGLGAIRIPGREVPRITDLVIASLPD